MNEAIKEVVKKAKKVLKRTGLPFWTRYEAEEVWGITDGKTLRFKTF